MNSHQYSQTVGAPTGVTNPRPPPLHNPETPIFMQPLLPPQQPQNGHYSPFAPSTHSYVTPDVDYYAQPPELQAQSSQSQQQSLQEHGRAPDSSGDGDDEYTLDFRSLEDFQSWRAELEERDSVEFIKADTHRSKAATPRFNENTRLVCARHCKGVRDKYTKMYPERSRQLPSRKIDGGGCGATISYRTYFGTPLVRVMYSSHHSHPIGRENLPFTRRGRKLMEQERKYRQQAGVSRPKPVLNGTTSAAGQETSNDTASRRGDVLRIEPPPMASLQPAGDNAATGVNSGKSYQNVVHSSSAPKPPVQMAPTGPQPRRVAYSPVDSLSCMVSERTIANDLPPPYEGAFPVPPRMECNRYVHTHASVQGENVQVPQLIHPIPQAEVHVYQTQYLPTPTTPSSELQNTHVHPNAYSYSRSLSQSSEPAQPVHTLNISDSSPVSPVAPYTQNPPGPLSANSQPSASHCSQQEEFFNEDRWNRMEALFQIVRSRARDYVLRESAISALESLLYQLYVEGPQEQPRVEPEQLFRDNTSYQQHFPSQ